MIINYCPRCGHRVTESVIGELGNGGDWECAHCGSCVEAYVSDMSDYKHLSDLSVNDIVRSKKQRDAVIPYIINAIEGENAKCTNLIDTYNYTIPLTDLYLWIVRDPALR